ncbi:unnamed protein product, partial [Laminaria digitata]
DRQYPYVIVGYGVAGQAALRSLLALDPHARVLVIDAQHPPPPDRKPPNSPASAGLPSTKPHGKGGAGGLAGVGPPWGANAGSGVEFAMGARATALDADRGTITISTKHAPGGEGTEGGLGKTILEEVKFGRCLLALGSRPRPPPPGFVDPAVWGGVSMLGARAGGGADREELSREVTSGKSVTVVGSSWQALELACSLQEGRSGSTEKSSGGVSRMVFPDFAPLDHVLPRYLSTALLRRLNAKKIKTIGHSSLRWVGPSSRSLPAPPPPPPPLTTTPLPQPRGGHADFADGKTDFADGKNDSGTEVDREFSIVATYSAVEAEGLARGLGYYQRSATQQQSSLDGGHKRDAHQHQQQRLQVMTAHSFDHLDTATHSTDRVILAGVDVAPLSVTLDLHGKDNAGHDILGPIARNKRAGTLEVDKKGGAVVVNAELAATSRVWAAGDVACFPSQAHGGRRLVLRSADHAYHSGKLAGENMAVGSTSATVQKVVLGASGCGQATGGGGRRYCHSPAFIGEAPLAGVRMATVGDCSAALPTHGFWWTNNATGLTRKTTAFSMKKALTRTPDSGDRGGVTLRSRKTARRDFTPVFGTGVVFYTDGAEVMGAMLWGFPGEATTAVSMGQGGVQVDGGGVGVGETATAADAAAGISARALDVLRGIMERSANIEADLSDERVLQAWVQGLSDAAKVVVQETGLGHLQPMRRSVPGRVTTSTRRPAGTQDELMYQNASKTSSAQRRLRAAYTARMNGISPQMPQAFYSSGGTTLDAEFDPDVMEFMGYAGGGGGGVDEEDGDGSGGGSDNQ